MDARAPVISTATAVRAPRRDQQDQSEAGAVLNIRKNLNTVLTSAPISFPRRGNRECVIAKDRRQAPKMIAITYWPPDGIATAPAMPRKRWAYRRARRRSRTARRLRSSALCDRESGPGLGCEGKAGQHEDRKRKPEELKPASRNVIAQNSVAAVKDAEHPEIDEPEKFTAGGILKRTRGQFGAKRGGKQRQWCQESAV